MTNPNSENRLDRIESVVANNTEAIAGLTQEMRELTSNVERVLARSAVLDDVLLELLTLLCKAWKQYFYS